MSLVDLLERASSRVTPRGTLRVRWYDAWHADLEAALRVLPEVETCPHDLFIELARTPSEARKVTALVSDGGEPIAVVGLRRRKKHWLALTDMVVPRAVAPAAPGRLLEAISTLAVYVRIADWEGALPEGVTLRALEQRQAWRVPTFVDLDAMWRRNGSTNMDTLRKARNRCHRLGTVELEIDAPGAAEWTINHWADKWVNHEYGLATAREDILASARWLSARGRYRSLRLLIDGRPVAGVNLFPAGDIAYAQNSYRDPVYAKSGVGVHLDELVYRWAACSSYRYVDLGCGDDYRGRWGEPADVRADFVIAPAHLYAARAGLQLVRSLTMRTIARANDAVGATVADLEGRAAMPDVINSSLRLFG